MFDVLEQHMLLTSLFIGHFLRERWRCMIRVTFRPCNVGWTKHVGLNLAGYSLKTRFGVGTIVFAWYESVRDIHRATLFQPCLIVSRFLSIQRGSLLKRCLEFKFAQQLVLCYHLVCICESMAGCFWTKAPFPLFKRELGLGQEGSWAVIGRVMMGLAGIQAKLRWQVTDTMMVSGPLV